MAKFDSGTVSIQANGQVINVKGSVTYSTHTESVETFRGVDGHSGSKFTPANPFVEVAVSDSSDINTQAFQNLQDVTVVVNQRNGKIVTFSECTQVNQVEVDAIEGEFTLRFEAKNATEQATA